MVTIPSEYETTLCLVLKKRSGTSACPLVVLTFVSLLLVVCVCKTCHFPVRRPLTIIPGTAYSLQSHLARGPETEAPRDKRRGTLR